jgi:transmembrane sensor
VLESIAGRASRERPRAGLLWLSAVTSVAVLAALTVGWLWLKDQGYLHRMYRTRVGQVRSVVLPDGSVAYLNTRTRLEWIGSPESRRVRLLGGEVFFEVVHDPSRSFRILLAHSEVQVLGTRFDVYQKADGDVVVTVVSGKVSVEGLGGGPAARPSWSRRLTSNEQIEYSPVGLVADVHRVRALSVIGWREGMIETRGERLARFIGNLSRYTSQRIVIADPRAAQMRIGGAFSVRNVDATLERIARIEPITVTHRDGEIIVGYRSLRGSGGSRS